MKNKNILILATIISISLSCKRAGAQMPAGIEPIFKPTSYNYEGWKIKKGEKVRMGDSSEAVVKSLELYKMNGWEKMYLRLQKADGNFIEGELEEMLRSGKIISPFPIAVPDLSNPDAAGSSKWVGGEPKYDSRDLFRSTSTAGAELLGYASINMTASIMEASAGAFLAGGAGAILAGEQNGGLISMVIGGVGLLASGILRSTGYGNLSRAGRNLTNPAK